MKKVLVAYFSASGVTKNVASKIAKFTNGDLFEIVPEKLYTAEDLDWRNPNSRSSLEMKDKFSRPLIKSKLDSNCFSIILFFISCVIHPAMVNKSIKYFKLQFLICISKG